MALPPAPPASFDSLRAAIHDRYERLSPHLQRIARFALDDPNRFALGTVAGIAQATEVQPSSENCHFTSPYGPAARKE